MALAWIDTVSLNDISFAYPFMGLVIVLVLVLVPAMFGESVPNFALGGRRIRLPRPVHRGANLGPSERVGRKPELMPRQPSAVRTCSLTRSVVMPPPGITHLAHRDAYAE